MRDAPVPSASPWPFIRLSPVCSCCLYRGVQNRTPDAASSGLSRGEGSPPSLAGNNAPNAASDATVSLCHEGALLAHVQLSVHQDPQVLFSKFAFHLFSPHSVLLLGLLLPRRRTLHFPFLNSMRFPSCPFPSPLNGSAAIWCISHSLFYICKLAEGIPSSRSLTMLNSTAPVSTPGNTTSDHSPVQLLSTHHNPLNPAVHPSFHLNSLST